MKELKKSLESSIAGYDLDSLKDSVEESCPNIIAERSKEEGSSDIDLSQSSFSVEEEDKDQIQEKNVPIKRENAINKLTCSHCKNHDDTPDNPIINTCACNIFIHLKCLRIIIKRLETRADQNEIIIIKRPLVICPKCKKKMTYLIRNHTDGVTYELLTPVVDFTRDFIILESIQLENKDEIMIIVIPFKDSKQVISIGSDQSNSIQL